MDELENSALDEEFEDWSDIDTANLTDTEDEDSAPDTEAENDSTADQPDGEQAEEKGEDKPEDKSGEEKAAEEQAADQTFELKHLDETRTVNREEVVALAQKGLDYDRIRAKLDELRAAETQAGENEQYAAFVCELAESAGVSVEEMIDGTRARVLADKAKREGRELSAEDALKQARQTREDATKKSAQSKELREARQKQERFAEEAGRFRNLFPEVKAEEIPAEVWQEYDKTGNLVDAWNRHQNTKLTEELGALRKELEGLKQERKNQERSTGSRKSAGAAKKSAVDAAWDAALENDW